MNLNEAALRLPYAVPAEFQHQRTEVQEDCWLCILCDRRDHTTILHASEVCPGRARSIAKERDEARRSLSAVEAALVGAPYSSEGLNPLTVSVILPLVERVRREAETCCTPQEGVTELDRLEEWVCAIRKELPPLAGVPKAPEWVTLEELLGEIRWGLQKARQEGKTIELAEATERASSREVELLAEVERRRAAEQAAKKDAVVFCVRSLTTWLAADALRRALVEQIIYAVEGGRIPAHEVVPALFNTDRLAELILATPNVNS